MINITYLCFKVNFSLYYLIMIVKIYRDYLTTIVKIYRVIRVALVFHDRMKEFLEKIEKKL